MKQVILVALIFVQSCASVPSKDIHRGIIDDIKNSKEYTDFVHRKAKECGGLAVSNYKYSVCSFGSFFKNEDIKSFMANKCTEEETFKSKKFSGLKKLSDTGETCFIADFSFEVRGKIAVEIISKKDKDKIGYESLHFLYDINNNQVKKLEGIEVVND